MKRIAASLVPILFFALSVTAEEEGDDVAAIDKLLGEAIATLSIDDVQWLDRITAKFSASSGINPVPVRGLISQRLFRSRTLEGIDLLRPALIAWRPGASPLVAIIPISDRKIFIDNFGAVPGMPEPLVRVNERNGTIVYSQNTANGVYEYRLLIQDNCAYLARTPEECRVLASRRLQPTADGPPLHFEASGAFFAYTGSVPTAEDMPGLPFAALLSDVLSYGVGRWNELVGDVGGVTLQLMPKGEGGEGEMLLHATLSAKATTPLSQWIGLQRNESSRLLPVVRGEKSFLTIHGSIVWKGRLERISGDAATFLRNSLGAASWTNVIDADWHSLWMIIDNQGPFACALDLGEGAQFSAKFITEQAKGQEMMELTRKLLEHFALPAKQMESVEIDGLFAQREVVQVGPQASLERVQAASQTHVFNVVANEGAAVDAIKALAHGVSMSPEPEGESAVMSLAADLTRLFRSGLIGSPTDPARLPQVSTTMTLIANAQSELELNAVIPLDGIAALMRESGLMQRQTPEAQPSSNRDAKKRK
jgi:hypothetical protein